MDFFFVFALLLSLYLTENKRFRQWLTGIFLFFFFGLVAQAWSYAFGGTVLAIIIIIGILVHYNEKSKKEELKEKK